MKYTYIKTSSLCLLLLVGQLLCADQLLQAQGLFENATSGKDGEPASGKAIDFGGYIRGSAFGGNENYDYSSLFGEIALQAGLHRQGAFMKADIRVRSGYFFGEARNRVEMKEAYGGYAGEKLDVFLGQQIVSWGRTDGFNPTNCITPNDYFFLSADPDDQKMPGFMLRMRYRLHPRIELDLIGIPVYRPSVYRYELFAFGEGVSFAELQVPDYSLRNGTLAGRLNVELDRAGFSFSAFRGYDPEYGFDVGGIDWSTGAPLIGYSPLPYRRSSLGADLSLPLGTWIVRAEMAWRHTEGSAEHMYVPMPDLGYVAGIEKNVGGVTAILQYVGKYVPGFHALDEPVLSDPENLLAQMLYGSDMIIYESALFNRKKTLQQEEFNHALALTLSKGFAYDTWYIELTAYYNFTSEEYLLRPKLSWDISDALTISAGGAWMDGKEGGIFDYAGPVLNGAFLECRVRF